MSLSSSSQTPALPAVWNGMMQQLKEYRETRLPIMCPDPDRDTSVFRLVHELAESLETFHNEERLMAQAWINQWHGSSLQVSGSINLPNFVVPFHPVDDQLLHNTKVRSEFQSMPELFHPTEEAVRSLVWELSENRNLVNQVKALEQYCDNPMAGAAVQADCPRYKLVKNVSPVVVLYHHMLLAHRIAIEASGKLTQVRERVKTALQADDLPQAHGRDGSMNPHIRLRYTLARVDHLERHVLAMIGEAVELVKSHFGPWIEQLHQAGFVIKDGKVEDLYPEPKPEPKPEPVIVQGDEMAYRDDHSVGSSNGSSHHDSNNGGPASSSSGGRSFLNGLLSSRRGKAAAVPRPEVVHHQRARPAPSSDPRARPEPSADQRAKQEKAALAAAYSSQESSSDERAKKEKAALAAAYAAAADETTAAPPYTGPVGRTVDGQANAPAEPAPAYSPGANYDQAMKNDDDKGKPKEQ